MIGFLLTVVDGASMQATISGSAIKYSLVLGTLFGAWLTYRIVNRANARGVLLYGYIFAIVMSVLTLSVSGIVLLTNHLTTSITTFYNGKSYQSKVVAYSSYQSYDSDSNSYTTMYTPIVQFNDDEGKLLEYEFKYSSSSIPNVGSYKKIYYDKENGNIVNLGAGFVILMIGQCVLIGGLSFVLVGVLIYASGRSMQKYKEFGGRLLMNFVLPALMILFECLLIYAAFYGNDVPGWVSFILFFFILVLGLSIWGYLKMILESKKNSDLM